MKKRGKAQEKALKLFVAGKYGQAAGLLKTILEKDPEHPRLWLRLGDAYKKLDEKKLAAEAYKSAADGFAGAGFLVQAISCLKQVIDLFPQDDQIHDELAELYSMRGMNYNRPDKVAQDVVA
ncbi:MAG: tetratricopeptide repeat protein, partial [Deltaproteobacteria bacterium]|nr:tetratricopeptide repeat protein [Deltaproteobacteria bacterium]